MDLDGSSQAEDVQLSKPGLKGILLDLEDSRSSLGLQPTIEADCILYGRISCVHLEEIYLCNLLNLTRLLVQIGADGNVCAERFLGLRCQSRWTSTGQSVV